MKSLPPKPPNGFGGAPPPNPPPPPGKRGPPRACGGPPPGPIGSYLAPGGTLQRGGCQRTHPPLGRRRKRRCVLCVVATTPTSSSPPEHGIVECRVHASTARSKPPASQRIMRPHPGRIQIPLPDIQRPPLPTYSPSWPVDFILVLEPRRGEVACWMRSPWLSSKRVTIRPRLGERR